MEMATEKGQTKVGHAGVSGRPGASAKCVAQGGGAARA